MVGAEKKITGKKCALEHSKVGPGNLQKVELEKYRSSCSIIIGNRDVGLVYFKNTSSRIA